MSILLCFCDSCLCHIMSCKILTKCIFQFYFLESYLFVCDRCVIICKADISNIFSCSSVKSVKIVCAEYSCHLTCTVRAEVKEDHCVFIFDRSYWFSILGNCCWDKKFICNIFCIRSIHCCYSTFCCLAFSLCKNVVCFLYTIPSVITIHCIITSGDRCDLSNTDLCHLSFQSFDKSFS